MILMRGSILDGNVKKRGGGVWIYFTLLTPSLLDLRRRRN